MTSSHHGPYVQGYTRVTMVDTKGCKTARWSKSHKVGLSSDWGLQFDPMKLKSLVIVYQNDTVNAFSDLVHTARHTTKAVCTRRYFSQPEKGAGI